MRKLVHILIAPVLAGALLPALARAEPGRGVDPRLIPGSRARQLLLKQALEKHLSGTLVAELNHNKEQWASMSPERMRKLREIYLAFLRMDDDKQVRLLEAAPDFERLSERQRELYRERAAWLKKVIASLTPEQREQLRNMPPAERAKRLLELKEALTTSAPTTQPADRPRPANAE